MHSNRRHFLKLGIAASTAGGLASVSGSAAGSVLLDLHVQPQKAPTANNLLWPNNQLAKQEQAPDRRLRLTNANTWEKLDLAYWSNGAYQDNALTLINHLMRDHRANASHPIDLDLLDFLHALYKLTGSTERLHVLSGYRTPETNAALSRRSVGVAKKSLHMEGRALDINIPGVRTKDLREAAISLKSGGVGYYASAGFVHIDTGTVRNWQA